MSNVRNGGTGGGLAFKSDFGVNSYVIKQLGVANTQIRNYRQSTFPTLSVNNADKYEFLTTERSKTIAPGDFKSMFLTGTSPRRKDLPRVNTPSQSNVKSETKNDIHKKIIGYRPFYFIQKLNLFIRASFAFKSYQSQICFSLKLKERL